MDDAIHEFHAKRNGILEVIEDNISCSHQFFVGEDCIINKN